MGIGTSIFLIAAGAILAYAVNGQVPGIELRTVGMILMIAGVIGLVISLFYMTMVNRRGTSVREREYVDRDQPVASDREIY